MSESEILRIKNRVEELKEGDLLLTVDGDISAQPVPEWLDKDKFYRARDVYKKYFACVNFSHLCGLLLSFYFSKNIQALKSTGESDTTRTLLHRYLATIRHIQKWYEGDVWDPNNPASKSLTSVKNMHTKVASKMAAKKDGIVYISQWDMAVTQWAFIGPLILFPSKVGLHGCSPEDYGALMHFWRGIGYLLGVEDKYNLCQGDYQEAVEACNGILQQYQKQVVLAEPTSVKMAQSVVRALSKIDSILTWGPLATYIHDLVGVQCPVSNGLLDWVTYSVLKFVIQVLTQYSMARDFLNDIFRWRLDRAERNALPFGLGWAKRILSEYSISSL